MRPCAYSSTPVAKHSAPPRSAPKPADDLDFGALFAAHSSELESTPETKPKDRQGSPDARSVNDCWVDCGAVPISCETNSPPPLPPAGQLGGAASESLESSQLPLPAEGEANPFAADVARNSRATPKDGSFATGEAEPRNDPGTASDVNNAGLEFAADVPAGGLRATETLTSLAQTEASPPATGELAPKETETPVQEPALPDGTAAAHQNQGMDLAQQQDENAGQEQNLPSAQIVPGPEPDAAAEADTNGRYVLSDPGSPGVSLKADAGTAPPDATVDATARGDLIEQIEASVESAASRLHHSDERSITITLRPLPGTELVMRVRMAEGRLEAAVEVHQGDAAMLSSDWPQLQQRLEKQGVHLDNLSHPTNLGGESRDQHRRREENPTESREPFAATFDISSRAVPLKPSTRSISHFESWA